MSICDLLYKASARYSDKTALIFGDRIYTYREFDEITDKLATALIGLGIQKGDRIALHLSNSPEIVFCYYACFKIGAVAVPLNNRLKGPEIEFILNHCQARICISQPALFSEIQLVRSALLTVERYYLVGDVALFPDVQLFEDLLQQPVDGITVPAVANDAVAVILYTSGTTAQPKGVTHTHYTLERTAAYHVEQAGLICEDIVGIMTSLSHMFAFGLQLLPYVSLGATLVIIPRFDPALVLYSLHKHRFTRLYGMPMMYNALVNYPDAAAYYLNSLQICMAGGDAVPVALQQRFQEIFGVEIMEACGMTEVVPYSWNLFNGEKQGSIGKAAVGMTLRLVDDQGQDVFPGEVGEILVKSDATMIGYWNNPEATAATLKDGWLHTGDLARIDADDYYWFVSRKKEIIIRGGSNISPLEVEAVLYQHPAVKEAGVIGVKDLIWGEIVQAYVALRDGESTTEEELKEFVRERIAAYKVPERIEFLPELPKGLTGKIHRKMLKG